MSSTGRLALVALAALAVLPAASAGTTGSGLYGVVKKGPIRPVCQVGIPCDAPVRVTLVFWSARPSGGTMEKVHEAILTDKHGRYRIALAPGFYEVRSAAKIGFTRMPKPHALHVRAGHWDKINLFCDTGLRQYS